jgi:hypothetical protein
MAPKKAALPLALVVLLGACTSEAKPALFGDTQQLTQAVSAGTARGGSAKFTTDISVGSVRTKGQGQARFGDGSTALSMTMDFFGEPMEIRRVDKILYVKVPESARGDDEKPWVQIPDDGTDPFSQAAGGSLGQLAQQNDPDRTVDQIKKAGTIVRGEQTQLDGAPVSHYWIDVELAKLSGELPAGVSAEAVQQVRGKADKFPMELWLNDRQLPVQVTMDLSPMLKAAGAPAGSAAKSTTRYTDWNSPADIHPPPADQLGPLPTPS